MHQDASRSILIVLCMVTFILGCSLMASGQTLKFAHVLNPPQKVFAVLCSNTVDFVAGLIEIVAQMHEQEGLVGSDAFKLYLFVSSPRMVGKLPLPPALIKKYCEFDTELFTNVSWMQAMGEFCAINQYGLWRPGVFDTRYRGLDKVMPRLAKLWDLEYLVSPEAAKNGDFGGNIEVTPDNILYYGDTMSESVRTFLKCHGYAGRTVQLQTSWLEVGVVDEMVAIIPSSVSPCGYAIVKADPRYALALINEATDEDFKKAALPDIRTMFLKVKAVLNNPKAWKDTVELAMVANNQEIGQIIDANVAHLIERIRTITKDANMEIPVIRWPVFFWNQMVLWGVNTCRPWLPNAVNHLALRNHLIIPEPYFAPFKRVIEKTARAHGNEVHFLDSAVFHNLQGGIHSATNVQRDISRMIFSPQEIAARKALRANFRQLHRDDQ